MLRRIRTALRSLLQGAYGVTIEILALATLFAAGAVIAIVLSQLV